MKIGLQAINDSGIQRVFAENLAKQSRDLGPIALRAPDQPSQRYAELAAAKSMDVKIKSSNWGPTVGHVSLDKTFGRIDGVGILLPSKTNPTDVEHYVVQEQTTLRDIFAHDAKAYQVTDFDEETGQLTFSVSDPYNNHAFKGRFLISLDEGVSNTTPLKKRFTREIDIPNEEQDKAVLAQLAKCVPHWDETRYGSLTDILNKHYPLYNTPTQVSMAEPIPVFVYSNDVKRPFTGDWDMLWVGLPEAVLPKNLVALAATPLNTQLPGNMDILNDSINPLLDALVTSNKITSAIADTILVGRQTEHVGVITPWEYLRVLMGNMDYQDPYINHLFQHGPENRTPYRPESLDGRVLHFIGGQIVLTENETELLELIKNPPADISVTPRDLDNDYLHIHPKWTSPTYSMHAEEWKDIADQQTEKWQNDLGITEPQLPLDAPHASVEKADVIHILDRFHVAKNMDYIEMYHPSQHVLERLSMDGQLHLQRHLLDKAMLLSERLAKKENTG